MVICLEPGAGFTFLVPSHPGSPGQRAVKRVCVCVRECVCLTNFQKTGPVVSVLDSCAERPGFKSQPRRSLRQAVHTNRACVHQAAKLVAALLRVAAVTAGLVESNGSLPPGL